MGSDKVKVLAQWRKDNWYTVMEDNRRVLEELRDNPKTPPNTRAEAAKTLIRMVAGLQVDRSQVTKPGDHKLPELSGKLTEKQLKEIEKLKNGEW